MRNRRIVIAAFTFLAATACYQYFPVDGETPLPETGDEVKVQLESPTSLDVGSISIHDVTAVEGHVYRSNADTLAMFSRLVRTAYGAEHFTNGAVFYFIRDDFRQLDVRRFVPTKTAIAAGATVAGVLIGYEVALRNSGGGGTGGKPPSDRTHIVAPLPIHILIRR